MYLIYGHLTNAVIVKYSYKMQFKQTSHGPHKLSLWAIVFPLRL